MFSQEEMDVFEYLNPGLVKAKNTNHGKIYIHLTEGWISFHQRWRYNFTLDQTFGKHPAKASPWTDGEQRDFHYAAKSLIWTSWNSQTMLPGVSDPMTQQIVDLLNKHQGISFSVSGKGDFAQKFAGRQLPIKFDVLISPKHPHFNVNVKKMLPGNKFVSNVTGSTINLKKIDTESHSVQQSCNGATSSDFVTLPHEFGHAIGYDPDEYKCGAVNRADSDSLMNIGKEIRPRHLRFIKDQLNTMLKDVKFNLPPN
jgi:hypothetical protein